MDSWATWCPRCLCSATELSALQSQLADKRVVFVDVTNESPAASQVVLAGRSYQIGPPSTLELILAKLSFPGIGGLGDKGAMGFELLDFHRFEDLRGANADELRAAEFYEGEVSEAEPAVSSEQL